MADEPAYGRRSDGRLERICAHGVGHTVAIDRVPFREGAKTYAETRPSWRNAWWTHGCDGCCRKDWRLHE